jgi:MFS family permease
VRRQALAVAAAGWGIAIVAASLAWNMPSELVAMLFVGYGSITFNSFAKTRLQLEARPSMRGRVMALWSLAWLGSTPVGGPIIGWIGEDLGARWALGAGGLACLACGAAAVPFLKSADQPPDAAEGIGDRGLQAAAHHP